MTGCRKNNAETWSNYHVNWNRTYKTTHKYDQLSISSEIVFGLKWRINWYL